MRKTILFLVLLCAPLTTEAQKPDSMTTSEIGIYYQKKDVGRVFLDGFEYFQNRVCGRWGFAYFEKKYLSSTAGLFCDVWFLEFGLGVGGESIIKPTSTNPTAFGRWAASIRIGGENHFLEWYYEGGNTLSEDWYQVELSLVKWRHLAFGGYAQARDGFGPRVRLSLPMWQNRESGKQTDLRFWVAPMYTNLASLKQRPKGLLLGGEIVGSLREPTDP